MKLVYKLLVSKIKHKKDIGLKNKTNKLPISPYLINQPAKLTITMNSLSSFHHSFEKNLLFISFHACYYLKAKAVLAILFLLNEVVNLTCVQALTLGM